MNLQSTTLQLYEPHSQGNHQTIPDIYSQYREQSSLESTLAPEDMVARFLCDSAESHSAYFCMIYNAQTVSPSESFIATVTPARD